MVLCDLLLQKNNITFISVLNNTQNDASVRGVFWDKKWQHIYVYYIIKVKMTKLNRSH